ncbi:MAG: hypothetical protein HPY80_05345 [Bacteroidales bacterium]|jgi:hypothetical protein|nr:hypothetical protein [Bacteroidales bacterium]NPV36078.1 hypothetical protein [Bacteroidales bacterium]
MKDFFARLLSTLLHPLLMPSYSILTLWFGPFEKMKNLMGTDNLPAIIGWMFLFSAIIPVILLITLKWAGIINSVTLNKRRDRKYPLLGTMISNLGLFWTFHYMGFGLILKVMALASATLILMSWIITLSWKISIHMASLGGYLAMVVMGFLAGTKPIFPAIVIMLLLSGSLGWARVERKAHSPAQVIAGLLLGMFILGAFMAPVVL